MLSIALCKGLSFNDFHELTPVEFDSFLYKKREYEDAERSIWEDQIRLINTFIFNSYPNLKPTARIKDPKNLYKIYSDHQQQQNKEIEYKPLSTGELEFLRSQGININ